MFSGCMKWQQRSVLYTAAMGQVQVKKLGPRLSHVIVHIDSQNTCLHHLYSCIAYMALGRNKYIISFQHLGGPDWVQCLYPSNLRASFCFLSSADSTQPANKGGQLHANFALMSSRGIQLRADSSFKRANGSGALPRCSSHGAAGAVLVVEEPPLKAPRLVAHRLQFQFVLFTILSSRR